MEYTDKGYVAICLGTAVLCTKKELPVLEYMDKSYMVTCLGTAVLCTKKELPVSEYKDRSYITTCHQRVVDMSLSCRCRVSD